MPDYRLKICVNYEYPYFNPSLHPLLLTKVNTLFTLSEPIFALFQMSNFSYYYGVVITYHNINLKHILNLFKEFRKDPLLQVFGYRTQENQKIHYLTSQNRLVYYHFENFWHFSMTSFMQSYNSAELIHQYVKSQINQQHYLIGLDGQTMLYDPDIYISDSHSLIADAKFNGCANRQVDYKRFELKNCLSETLKNTLIINIGKNGLKNLAWQVVKLKFAKIIYILCSDRTFENDHKILKNVYEIDDQFEKRFEKDLNVMIIIYSLKEGKDELRSVSCCEAKNDSSFTTAEPFTKSIDIENQIIITA